MNFVCLKSLTIPDIHIDGVRATTTITVETLQGDIAQFPLILKYEHSLLPSHIPLLRIAFCIPLLNYGLFSKNLILKYPLSQADYTLLKHLNTIFSRDIFVNKILRRRANYILPSFHPQEETVTPQDALPKMVISPQKVVPDTSLGKGLHPNSCGVLSSGGKESLLTYGLLKELGAEVHPLYVNESGGHWRTALTGYRYHQAHDPRTSRVWANVDQFYNFMLDHLVFIRPDHRTVRADTYPIRLCVFPFYIFSLLPLFIERHITHLLLGSEFDDLRSTPVYHGIPHYYGIYDQHQDFDDQMNQWYSQRIPGMSQWSAVRNISGLIVERILLLRYPHLARLQRSCHSCHIINGESIPCCKCSKCYGVLLFLLANKANPQDLKYPAEEIATFINTLTKMPLKLDEDFANTLAKVPLRLDEDEKNHALYLFTEDQPLPLGGQKDHVEMIHHYRPTCDIEHIPSFFRPGLLSLLEHYTSGYCRLNKDAWIPIQKSIISKVRLES